MRIRQLILIAFLAAASTTHAQDSAPKPARAVLVELFTSEGCSSCPPADALLREMDGTRTPDGHLIVALSEHVTYWNRLGWTDPYSAETFTSRQAAYAERFRLDSSYTPQIVVNGSQQFVGSNGEGVMRALRQIGTATSSTTATVRIASANLRGRQVDVTYAIGGDVPAGADLFAVLADDRDTSQVLRGENSGETLQHVSVARSLVRVKNLSAARDETLRLEIPVEQGDATQHRHVVLFLQSRGLGPVLAVDTKPLSPTP
jgi:hypothetical protein